MKNEILKMLVEAGSYVSGEEMSRRLGISRAAVWKKIKAIKDDGGKIEAQTNKGYFLLTPPDLLKGEYVSIYSAKPAEMIEWLAEVDSTNNYAKAMARNGAPDGTVIFAEHQTGGKGRLNRVWKSNPHEAVQMSMILRPKLDPARAPGLNFAIALGVVSAIYDTCGLRTKIKWPNDVIFENKKLCGILIEMSSDMDGIEYAVCGAGVNVNQESFDSDIAQRASSLRRLCGGQVSRVKLAAAMIDKIEVYIKRYLKGGMDEIRKEYNASSAVLDKVIVVKCGDESLEGTCSGFGENGELILTYGNKKRIYHAGEVSIRGVNDYV